MRGGTLGREFGDGLESLLRRNVACRRAIVTATSVFGYEFKQRD